jgi:hypothetical protein
MAVKIRKSGIEISDNLAGIFIAPDSISGKINTTPAAVTVQLPTTGTWSYLFNLAASSGTYTANTKHLTAQTDALVAILPIKVGASNGYIPVMANIPLV